MGKIDDYRHIKQVNENAIKKMRLVVGYYEDYDITNPQNDKHNVVFTKSSDDHITVELTYGFTGEVVSHIVDNEIVKNYIVEALNFYSERIILKAKSYAERDIDEAREECRSEAQAILDELASEETVETEDSNNENNNENETNDGE